MIRRIFLFLCTILLGTVSCWAAPQDGWIWKPEGKSAIRPVGEKVTAREYAVKTTGALSKSDMFGVVTNYGATGAIKLTLQKPSGYRSFTVFAKSAHKITVAFPTGANPYLNDVQVGVNGDIEVNAGDRLIVEYDDDNNVWRCYTSWISDPLNVGINVIGEGGVGSVVTVETLPESPDANEVVMVVDCATPCNTTEGGGSYFSMFRWDDTGKTWVCLAAAEDKSYLDKNVEQEPVATDQVLVVSDPSDTKELVRVPISDIIALHTAESDPHTGYMLESNVGVAGGNYLKLHNSPGTATSKTWLAGDMKWSKQSDILGVCTVATIPVDPATGDVIFVIDGANACDTVTGGGDVVSILRWDGSNWQCVSTVGDDVEYIIEAVNVSGIPEDPIDGQVIIVRDCDSPCMLLGGGSYVSIFQWDEGDEQWVCLSTSEVNLYKIFTGDSKIEVSENKAIINIDGTDVAEFTKDETRLGPIATTINLESDNAFSSAVLTTGGVAGAPIGTFQTAYVGADGKYYLADANAAGKFPADGISVNSGNEDEIINVLKNGIIRNDSWSFTAGDLICLSETTGEIVKCSNASLCSADGDCVQIIGRAVASNIVDFNFTKDFVTCTGD